MTLTTTKARYLGLQDALVRDKTGVPVDGALIDDGVYFLCSKSPGVLDGDGKIAIMNLVDGHVEYWRNGKLHRPLNDGPAVASIAGEYGEYWLDGVRIQ